MDYSTLVEYDLKNNRSKKKDIGKKNESNSKPEETRKRSRSRSPLKIEEPIINYDIPSRQFGDLYCAVCDSHMNSEQMWDNHIKGKRHLKNSSKGDAAEPNYEYSNEDPIVQKELDKETRPIAGLDHICEILRVNQTTVYQCFLCSASLPTTKMLMEHIMGLKHQMAFLKEHDKSKYALVDSSALSKAYLEPIVQDLISKYETEHGRGKMSVKKEKEKAGSSYSYKKSKEDEDGDKRPVKSLLPKSSKTSPPRKSVKHGSPPRSSRYSPPRSLKHSPPRSLRHSPPRSLRGSPPRSSRCSPPPKSSRMKERQSESEWKKVPPVRELSRDRHYSDRSFYSDEEYGSTSHRTHIEDDRDSVERSNSYRWSSLDQGKNFSDLRAVIEKKKSLAMTSGTSKSNRVASEAVPGSSKITSVTEQLLSLINDLSPEVFLKLALFKLDNMAIKEEIELILLDRVANKAAEVAKEIKMKSAPPDLKAKFNETLAQNGIISSNTSRTETSQVQFTQNLENLIGHYKARKSTVYEDVHPVATYSSHLNSSEQFTDDNSIPYPPLNTSSYQSTPERGAYDAGLNQKPSNSLPFQSFSSTPASIPGLTLTEEKPSTAMSQFAQTAKSIFGSINVPSSSTFSYQSDDYNRLNFRY